MSEQAKLFETSPLPRSHYGYEIEDAPAIARRDDPATSRNAAAKVDVGRCERIFLRTLNGLGIATAYEVAAASGYRIPDTIRKRAGALKEKKLIRVVGHGRHPETGNNVERFALTAAGFSETRSDGGRRNG